MPDYNYVVVGLDYDDCWYEGDQPRLRIKFFMSTNEAWAYLDGAKLGNPSIYNCKTGTEIY